MWPGGVGRPPQATGHLLLRHAVGIRNECPFGDAWARAVGQRALVVVTRRARAATSARFARRRRSMASELSCRFHFLWCKRRGASSVLISYGIFGSQNTSPGLTAAPAYAPPSPCPNCSGPGSQGSAHIAGASGLYADVIRTPPRGSSRITRALGQPAVVGGPAINGRAAAQPLRLSPIDLGIAANQRRRSST